jgi:hypothetical protein
MLPIWLRLSYAAFHVWLPVVLVWSVFRLGYDHRALAVEIVALISRARPQ